MTERQAKKLTKYFAAGVSASIWRYSGIGNWQITVKRGRSLSFYDLDELKREVLTLRKLIETESRELVLYSRHQEDLMFIQFHSPEEARECIREISKAVKYVQAISAEQSA